MEGKNYTYISSSLVQESSFKASIVNQFLRRETREVDDSLFVSSWRVSDSAWRSLGSQVPREEGQWRQN